LTSHLATFDVYSYEFDEVRRIDLVEDLEEKHLEFVKREWTPRLADRRARAVIAYHVLPTKKQHEQAWQEKQGRFGAPDSHWDWNYKKQSMLGFAHRMFALLDGEVVEALMRIDLSKPSRIQPTPYTPVVYVDYLAVAPWNRPPIQSPPRFKGFGKLLLGAAVSISVEEGMDGRCGLHSLTQSEGFYSRVGMKDLGVDAASGLKYFEFSPDAARKFLET
jgi:hypothetical protein